ncbi:MAG: hypothetical protein KCHDKBKB_01279 [Elusimicrobia bacterium]|nr:hypothetical protein [Elusimicrobiota bacterium]
MSEFSAVVVPAGGHIDLIGPSLQFPGVDGETAVDIQISGERVGRSPCSWLVAGGQCSDFSSRQRAIVDADVVDSSIKISIAIKSVSSNIDISIQGLTDMSNAIGSGSKNSPITDISDRLSWVNRHSNKNPAICWNRGTTSPTPSCCSVIIPSVAQLISVVLIADSYGLGFVT